VGLVPTYKHFSGFGFFLLSKGILSRPPAANANRWQAEPKSKCKTVFDSQVSFYRRVGKAVSVLAVAFFKSVFESDFQFAGFQVLFFLFNKFSFCQQSFGLVLSSR